MLYNSIYSLFICEKQVTYIDFVKLDRIRIEKRAKEILEEAEKMLIEKGMTVKTLFKQGHPADIICKTAAEDDFNLVALGSRGLGKIEEMILGSVSSRVAHCSKASVLIIK
ncbi:MAG: universal stress protein [Bacillota bacterium]|nr:universal stress protein [Bacillota bacterium]